MADTKILKLVFTNQSGKTETYIGILHKMSEIGEICFFTVQTEGCKPLAFAVAKKKIINIDTNYQQNQVKENKHESTIQTSLVTNLPSIGIPILHF